MAVKKEAPLKNSNKLNPDFLTSTGLKYIVEILGVEAVEKLIENSPGINIYIPKTTRSNNELRHYIISNINVNPKTLAVDTGLSESHVLRIIRNYKTTRFI